MPLIVNEPAEHFFVASAKSLVRETEGKPNAFTSLWDFRFPPDITCTEQGVERYVDALAGGNLTHFFINVNYQRSFYPSQVIEPIWASLDEPDRQNQPFIRDMRDAFARGFDAYAVMVRRCRERGVSPWLSFRMNDIHGTQTKSDPMTGTFWREHPEWHLNKDAGWANGLDYAEKAVRDRMSAYIREAVGRYDVDGVELDLIRFPFYFRAGTEKDNAPLLTAFVREIRKTCEAAAARRGHPVKLAVRLLPDPKQAEKMGADVGAWAREGLVDLVIPCNMYGSIEYEYHLDDWRKLLGERVRIVAGTDNGIVENGKRRILNLDEYRRWIDLMRRNGSDGVYFFNFPLRPYRDETWRGILGTDSRAASAEVVIENGRFRLEVGRDAAVRSLVLKATGEECVPKGERIPLFSVTQDRPYNNEIKLIHSHKRTTYPANALRRDGDRLVVGFEIAPYEAVVELKVTDSYVEFKLVDFLVDKEDYNYLKMDVPPVAAFRILQMPVLNRKYFGDWLNASWDEKSAVGVVGTSPYADIDHENRTSYRILTADLVRGQKLKGASAALIVAGGREDFLDCMDRLERDFDLPLGVESRRSDSVNAFIYHVAGRADLGNIDRHIEWAKRGGFKFMTFETSNFNKNAPSWALYGDYDWSEQYPNGAADLKKLLGKVKAAGIRPGLHFLHTHIGLKSRYVTPVADPRLNKTRRFTLAKPLDDATNATEITVFEPTEGVTTFEPCRVLQFGGELVSYASYTKEPPYRFLGVKRGAWNTKVTSHPYGEVGGILDVSEYGTPMSCYIDQNTDLQQEVSAKIAAIYNCGFEYAYFDGSEGVNAPCNFHVSNAQYRQWKMLEPKPLFSEGAAKSHFGWHILSGANAFDCFGPDVFKRNIVRFPVAQAPHTWQDMTRVNFGWWCFWPKGHPAWRGKASDRTVPDHWQFACSQCLAWDCPATVLVYLDSVEADRKNAEACFEVMRLWEEARSRRLLSREQKEMLKDTTREFHLSIVDGRAVLTEQKR